MATLPRSSAPRPVTSPASFALLGALALLGGCAERDTGGGGAGGDGAGGGGVDTPAMADCALGSMREWVDASMRDYYLFADRVPPVRLADFDSDEAVLDALRVDPPDRYSYLADEAVYDALFDEGETFGFGWQKLKRTSDGRLLFALILPGSPLARAGVVRGDALVAIGGVALADFGTLPPDEQDRHLGFPDTPTSVVFTIDSPTRGRFDATVRSETFPLLTVQDVDVAERGGARVGYLHFTSFLGTSSAELERAFATLAAADIDELVLDLRYNGGGRVGVAQALAGALGGRAVSGETFARFRFNARYAQNDLGVDFAETFAPLDLARVLVLTSAETCSASELVINALEPFVDVVTVGEATCGKPYGTAPERRCGRVLNALEVGFENAAGVGGYTDGLAADCAAADDPRTALGRPGDPLYDAALGLVTSGSCALAATARGGTRRPSVETLLPGPRPPGGAILP